MILKKITFKWKGLGLDKTFENIFHSNQNKFGYYSTSASLHFAFYDKIFKIRGNIVKYMN